MLNDADVAQILKAYLALPEVQYIKKLMAEHTAKGEAAHQATLDEWHRNQLRPQQQGSQT